MNKFLEVLLNEDGEDLNVINKELSLINDEDELIEFINIISVLTDNKDAVRLIINEYVDNTKNLLESFD